jgi:hypothetical protein
MGLDTAEHQIPVKAKELLRRNTFDGQVDISPFPRRIQARTEE